MAVFQNHSAPVAAAAAAYAHPGYAAAAPTSAADGAMWSGSAPSGGHGLSSHAGFNPYTAASVGEAYGYQYGGAPAGYGQGQPSPSIASGLAAAAAAATVAAAQRSQSLVGGQSPTGVPGYAGAPAAQAAGTQGYGIYGAHPVFYHGQQPGSSDGPGAAGFALSPSAVVSERHVSGNVSHLNSNGGGSPAYEEQEQQQQQEVANPPPKVPSPLTVAAPSSLGGAASGYSPATLASLRAQQHPYAQPQQSPGAHLRLGAAAQAAAAQAEWSAAAAAAAGGSGPVSPGRLVYATAASSGLYGHDARGVPQHQYPRDNGSRPADGSAAVQQRQLQDRQELEQELAEQQERTRAAQQKLFEQFRLANSLGSHGGQAPH